DLIVTGVQTCALPISVPADYQARLRFITTGGQMWKSVGLSFDVAGDNDVLVYLSAVSGGSKLQIAYKQNGNYVYPTEAMQARDRSEERRVGKESRSRR